MKNIINQIQNNKKLLTAVLIIGLISGYLVGRGEVEREVNKRLEKLNEIAKVINGLEISDSLPAASLWDAWPSKNYKENGDE
jgi:hypothetical protein